MARIKFMLMRGMKSFKARSSFLIIDIKDALDFTIKVRENMETGIK